MHQVLRFTACVFHFLALPASQRTVKVRYCRIVQSGFLLAAGFLVVACGGGGSSESSTPQVAQAEMISGRVADGYIVGATVFWDCNGNNFRTYAVRTQLARSSDFCDLSRRRTLALKAGQAPVSCNWTASFL